MANLRILALTYHTFPAEFSAVQQATIDVLKRMGMRVLPEGFGGDGSVSILASAWRRQLQVEFEPRGIDATRVRVLAKEGVFFEENAATDLIAQVTCLLEQRRGKPIRCHTTGNQTSVAILSAQAGAVTVAS